MLGEPVGAVRGIAARKLLAVALIAAQCGTSGKSVDAIVPFSTIVPRSGGSQLPDPARVLLRETDSDLKAGNFDSVVKAAQRAREAANSSLPAAPVPGTDAAAARRVHEEEIKTTTCIADAVQGVADVNRRNVVAGLQELQRSECATVTRVTFAAFLTLTSFWSVAIDAQIHGLENGPEIAQHPAALPGVVVFSPHPRFLHDTGIRETVLFGDQNSRYYRYDGLRLLVRASGRYILLPANWQSGRRAVVLPDSSAVRLEFF